MYVNTFKSGVTRPTIDIVVIDIYTYIMYIIQCMMSGIYICG